MPHDVRVRVAVRVKVRVMMRVRLRESECDPPSGGCGSKRCMVYGAHSFKSEGKIDSARTRIYPNLRVPEPCTFPSRV
jgi:hypothetical protein